MPEHKKHLSADISKTIVFCFSAIPRFSESYLIPSLNLRISCFFLANEDK